MDRVTLASVTKSIPTILHNPQTPIFICGILCVIGAWVVITKIIQLIFSLLWPFMMLFLFFVVIPNFSPKWFSVWLPEQYSTAVNWMKNAYEEFYEDCE